MNEKHVLQAASALSAHPRQVADTAARQAIFVYIRVN